MTAAALPQNRPFEVRHRTGRVAGLVVEVVLDVAAIYVAHHILVWGWPAFVTASFADVLPIITASMVVDIVAALLQMVYDRDWFRSLLGAVTGAVTLAATIRLYQVFPFDFTDGRDWSGALRVLLVLAILGTGIAVVVNLAKAFVSPLRTEERDPVR